MATGHKIVILKNDTTRFTAKCEEDGCGWRIHFEPVNGDTSRFVLKDSNAHRCTLWYTVLVVLLNYMFLLGLCDDPSLKPKQIMSLFKKTYGSNIKYHHARRGKEVVFEEQYGDEEKSYSNFTWYVKAIEETNPDSYVKFEVEDGINRLLFICFGACKHSYRYLRPMIYLDAPSSLVDTGVMRIRSPLLICFTKLPTPTHQRILKKLCVACMQFDLDMLLTISGLFQRRNLQNAVFPVCRYNAHSSTLAESLNNWVLEFKKLPAFALLDAIRLKVMKKMYERRIEGLDISTLGSLLNMRLY
ncbi:uncharacterized protein LOC113296545 [Papaver somniferum]|uniref:uncharacterized protein LOC113296545 n=1 Tax=Papaver somniferum TaxID=3469 RepID=UPI000E6FA138|nr:uncharacterized protein LOC113296545 [Papaver somniferum]